MTSITEQQKTGPKPLTRIQKMRMRCKQALSPASLLFLRINVNKEANQTFEAPGWTETPGGI